MNEQPNAPGAARQVGTIEHRYSTEKERVDGVEAYLTDETLPVGTKLYVMDASGVKGLGDAQG
jgi:hypothetical protein